MTTINLDILNGELIEEEIEVQVEFDYDAAEPEFSIANVTQKCKELIKIR